MHPAVPMLALRRAWAAVSFFASLVVASGLSP